MKTKITRALLPGLAVMCLIAAAVAPLAAHHSFATFNMTAEKTITGNVKTLEWTNPHIWLWIDVPNDKGGKDTYGFEGMSPNFLERRGWTRTTLKAGDKITVTYHPLREGNNGGMFMTGKMESGKILTSGGSND
jgi:hypothetical protein